MIALSLEEISAACGGELVSDKNIIITSITTDSRKACAGCLFAAIKGERSDGHDYIGSAAKAGAAAVICEKRPEGVEIPYILVKSTLKALQDTAAYILKKAGIPVVGIGGSVGKTSTKEAVASVLSQKFKVLKTEGNFNNELGLPLTIFGIEDETQIAVLEMGISEFGEMHVLASIARPDICVLTNIGDCHLEALGDRAGVFKEKSCMFDFLQSDGHIVLNGDDEYLLKVGVTNGVSPVFYGLKASNELWADNISTDGIDGTSCDIHTKAGSISVFIPKPGVHMVYNALAAASVGLIMGLSLDEIKRGIESQETVQGRFRIIEKNNIKIIDDCYNANPMSMKASLEALSRAKGRRVAILGDMGELGADEARLHSDVGEYAASLGIELVICIGKLSRNIAEAAVKGENTKVEIFDDIEGFAKEKERLIHPGDTVLVKASHFMNFPKVVDILQEK